MAEPLKKKKIQEDEVKEPYLRPLLPAPSVGTPIDEQVDYYLRELNNALDKAFAPGTINYLKEPIYCIWKDILNGVTFLREAIGKDSPDSVPNQKIIEKRFIFLYSLVAYDMRRFLHYDENIAHIPTVLQFIREQILQPLANLLHIPESALESSIEITDEEIADYSLSPLAIARSTLGSIPIISFGSDLTIIPPEKRLACLLHCQLKYAGAYEILTQITPQGAVLLDAYLMTSESVWDIGKLLGLTSQTRSHELLHSSMAIAFPALPEHIRKEYGNNPKNALKVRTSYQTPTKSKRIKDDHSQRHKNPETGKIEISDIQRKHMKEGAKRRWQQYHAEKSKEHPNQQ